MRTLSCQRAMGAEMEDMILSWGHLYLTYNTPCVDPPGEALPNNEIFRRLAQRMGLRGRQFQVVRQRVSATLCGLGFAGL